MGFGARMVITGDVSQIELPPTPVFDSNGQQGRWAPRAVRSGLVESLDILKNTQGIGIYKFLNSDVVRHPMVSRIVNAYDKYQNK